HITVPTETVDVNVHPTKMEVRFSNQNSIYKLIAENIAQFLSRQEMIPDASPGPDKKLNKNGGKKEKAAKIEAPEPFEKERKLAEYAQNANTVSNVLNEDNGYHSQNKYHSSYDYEDKNKDRSYNYKEERKEDKKPDKDNGFFVDNRDTVKHPPENTNLTNLDKENAVLGKILGTSVKENDTKNFGVIKSKDRIIVEKPEQLNFFDEKILTKEARKEYKIVGQVFDTYWIIEYRDKMLMIDQHAAHEKVKYEQILKKVESNEVYTQILTPPVVISVTPKEADLINGYEQYFKELGFEIEDFGMNAFAIRGVPLDLFGHDIKDLFEEVLTQMTESPVRGVPLIIREKIASMACKAAVKGNNSLSYEEADKLIEQLLELDNPYNCPHGRPTMISMSKYEIEKKFKRII
nr:DNA mismatch repair protein MutL [Lachnospiraceae bacterium]